MFGLIYKILLFIFIFVPLLFYSSLLVLEKPDPVVQFFAWFIILGSFLQFFVLYFGTIIHWDSSYKREKVSLDFLPVNLPSIDVLIPRYKEELGLLNETLRKIREIDYPLEKHQVWVLDDGHSEDCQKVAHLNGFNYLSRPDNQYAKAGNLNYALNSGYLKGQFILVLDCDFLPKKRILKTLVAKFQELDDGLLAFIQTPQDFHNYSYSKDFFDMKNSFFTKVIIPSLNNLGLTPYVGTNSLIKTSYLKEIGGFYQGHITEDVDTGLSFHSAGYHSYYFYDKLAFGLAPLTLSEAFEQRLRWIKGLIQLFLQRSFQKLSLKQKIAYFQFTGFWIGFTVILVGLFWSIFIQWWSAFKLQCYESTLFYFLFDYYLIYCLFAITLIGGKKITLRAKLRTFQMFVNYFPVYFYAFFSVIFPNFFKKVTDSLSKKSSQSKHNMVFRCFFEKHFLLFVNYSILFCWIFSLSFKLVWLKDKHCWIQHLWSSLVEIACNIIVFYPTLKDLFLCTPEIGKNPDFSSIRVHSQPSSHVQESYDTDLPISV